MLYTKEHAKHQSTVYLTIALFEPIMTVLADDQLDLEVEPTMFWSRYITSHMHVICIITPASLPEDHKVRLFGSSHGSIPLNYHTLVQNAQFRACDSCV